MQDWEYITLLTRQNSGKIMEVIQINNKEAKAEITGWLFKSKSYETTLSEFLLQAGREGWEVSGMAPTTTFGASNGAIEGAINILILLKRHYSQAEHP
jgi:hypothetical protein